MAKIGIALERPDEVLLQTKEAALALMHVREPSLQKYRDLMFRAYSDAKSAGEATPVQTAAAHAGQH